MARNYSPTLPIGFAMEGSARPVFWDPHTCVLNNKPPVTIITGQPGTGKTFFGSLLIGQSAMMGKRTVVFDPKGDFLVVKNLQDEGYIENVRFINIANSQPGMLDPFFMSNDPKERTSIVTGFVDTLIGGMNDDQKRVLSVHIRQLVKSPNASLSGLVTSLRGSMSRNVEDKNTARNLGGILYSTKELKYADVCFAPATATNLKPINIDSGCTIITMAGLKLPDANKTIKDFSTEEKLSSAILYILVDFLHRILNSQKSHDENGKIILSTILIDEANIVVSSNAGAQIIEKLGNLGRSKKCSTILMSQNNSHFKRLNINNAVSTRFTFCVEDREDARTIIEGMGLDRDAKESEIRNYVQLVNNLSQGQVLMCDMDKRQGRVKIEVLPYEWFNALERKVEVVKEN